MIKNVGWNTFKNTGNINTYLEIKKIKDLEENLVKENLDGTNKGKGDSNFRK